MIRVDVDFTDDGTLPVAPADSFRRFQAVARELAETTAGVGDWPSLAALNGFDAACVRDRFACAAAFLGYAIAELAIVRETLDGAAVAARSPDVQAKEAADGR